MTQLEEILYPAKNTTKKAEKYLIWLHGLGADARDFFPIVPLLNLPGNVQIIFPNAPVRAITVNNGAQMRAWHNMSDFSFQGFDRYDIEDSFKALAKIHRRLLEGGVAPQNIVFAGFSQGGAMALHCAVRLPCAAVVVLSGYLAEALPRAQEKMPNILLMHGENDPVVPYAMGIRTKAALELAGYKPEWKHYAMGHEVCAPQIRDLAQWLRRQLAL